MASDIAAARTLVELLRSRPPLPAKEARRRYRGYFGLPFWPAAHVGKRIIELTGFRGVAFSTLDHDNARAQLRREKDDLRRHVEVTTEAINRYYDFGEGIAPYSAIRICIILRRAKEYSLEAAFAGALLAAVPRIAHAQTFEHRRARALHLAKR